MAALADAAQSFGTQVGGFGRTTTAFGDSLRRVSMLDTIIDAIRQMNRLFAGSGI